MSAIDRYGEFELPEEKVKIEIVENPVRTVMSAYELFRKMADERIEKYFRSIRTLLPKKEIEELYDSAVKLFEGKEKLRIDLDASADILDLIRRKIRMYDATGLFLSALQNKTDLEALLIHNFPAKLDYLGYQLDSSKKLITDKTDVWFLGNCCRGIIINSSNNYNNEFAKEAENGIQINLGRIGSFGADRKGGIQINSGTVYLKNTVESNAIFDISVERIYENKNLKTASSILRILAYNNHSHEDLLNLLKTFDWKEFEKEIKAVAKDFNKGM